jgi:hypothetical protein
MFHWLEGHHLALHGDAAAIEVGSPGQNETGHDVEGVNRPGVSGHFTSFESESERHVIIEAVKQLSARVA